ncbi:hypothetical protein BCR44DRAFT_1518241 [Catenaria anguillulae PL171]|uniref:UNC93-like protein MFSD11 n=1 Tax=Catenaria anguillulae PL171 TaxID=765915 RepID=A0A1Y2H6P8_9FUNG|nr:hypothetical protein BCR44DRAFT_1518241 [Catenaria anguillulae PL171]
MFGSVVAPVLIPRYLSSPRFVLFGAAAMHCLFAASINLGPTALLVCSAGVGFSASFLWLQQGLYVTGVSQRAGGKIGKLTSIFFGIFNINMVIGNLISLVIESVGSAPTTVIWALTVIAGVAGVAFLAIPNLPPAKVSGLNAPSSLPRTDQSRSTIASNGPSVSLLAVCRAAPMRNLAPIIIFSGAFVTFIFGTLPIIADPLAKSISIHIALAFVSYGVAAALGAFVWGRLFDWRGPRAILYAQLAIGSVAFILFLAVLIHGPNASLFPVVMVASALCGALETATTTLINTCISVYVRPLMSHKDSAIAAAFSLYRILYCCGFVFVSLVTAAVPREQVVARAAARAQRVQGQLL